MDPFIVRGGPLEKLKSRIFTVAVVLCVAGALPGLALP